MISIFLFVQIDSF